MSTKATSAPEVAPPLTLTTLKKYAQEIFTPIRRGESVTTIWTPMMGRRVRNKFIIAYPELFKEEIGNLAKYLLVYVEPLELTEESNSGFIRLIARSILEAFSKKSEEAFKIGAELSFDESLGYSTLLDRLAELTRKVSSIGLETVLFLGEFDEMPFANSVLYNNLKALWVRSNGKLHFVFLLLEDVTRPAVIEKYGELNSLLLKNIVYIPLLKKEDVDYLIDYFSKELGHKFSKEERGIIAEACGGHPYLIKSCVRLVALLNGNKLAGQALKDFLHSHFEPRSVCRKIFDLLGKKEQHILREVTRTGVISDLENARRILGLELVKKSESGEWVLFSELFTSVTLGDPQVVPAPTSTSNGNNGSLSVDLASGAIFYNGANVEEKFTRQEYEILKFFLKEPDCLHSREAVGEAMWGKESYDKYSDWAIDQIMSKIRKKLKGLGAERALVTVRGRGYKLSL